MHQIPLIMTKVEYAATTIKKKKQSNNVAGRNFISISTQRAQPIGVGHLFYVIVALFNWSFGSTI